MSPSVNSAIGACLRLTQAIGRARTVDDIYPAALDALEQGLGVQRAAVLLFDDDGVMRFKAWRGLSDAYRAAVEGHTPWTRDAVDPQPLVVSDVRRDASLAAYLPTIEAERIRSMVFVPLVNAGEVVGKFMLYRGEPHLPDEADLQLAGVIGAQVAFAVARTAAEERARRSEARLRFALDAASMGTWDWDLATNRVRWSDNLEIIHGLPKGTFDGSFASYEREIHAEDRDRVLGSARRALETGAPHDVEYRIVAPDGTVRWVEGKGRVEFRDGQPVAMTGVCMNVTRRKVAELARLDAAHEASRLKDEFLAVLSHELRTPLNAVIGWGHLLQRGDLSPAQSREALDVVVRNARMQAQLIEDIIDISRIAAGKLALERAPLHVAQVIANAVDAIRPVALAKGVALAVGVDERVPRLDGDAKRLEQVVGNLLSNAVKFTAQGGRVGVQCHADDDTIVLEVRDTGIGIAPEFLPSVFERFRQADGRSTRRHGGLGLGLAIARHLVEEHGGTISAHSDGPGCGACFVVRLPAVPGEGAHVERAGTSPTERATDADLDGARVLVVDDDADARDLMHALLHRSGATVHAVASADEATHALAREPFDVLLSDIAMPETDGYDLVRRCKASFPSLIAVAITAYARPQDRTRALDAGFDAYESKPLDAGRLLGTIASLRDRRPSALAIRA